MAAGSYVSSLNDCANAVGCGAAGGVDIRVPGDIVLEFVGAGFPTSINTTTLGSGPAGAINIAGHNISLLSGAAITSSSGGSGAAGNVTIAAAGDVVLQSATTLPSSITAGTSGKGAAGVISVSARNITLAAGSTIQSNSLCASSVVCGKGGDVSLTAADGIVLQSGNSPTSRASLTATTAGGADGGAIHLAAQGITMTGNAVITASSNCAAGSGCGNAGDITLNAAGGLVMDSTASSSESAIVAQTMGSGRGGSIYVTAHDVTLRSGSRLTAAAFGSGAAGGVTVSASGQIVLDSAGSANSTGLLSHVSAQTQGGGDAGSISVVAQALTLLAGSFVDTDVVCPTGAQCGAGGNVTVKTADDLSIAAAGVPGTAISARTAGAGAKSGGSVTLNVGGALSIEGVRDAEVTGISSASTADVAQGITQSNGNAGDVIVNAGRLDLRNGGGISTSTGGAGHGGSIHIATGAATLSDGAAITARSDGSGDAGSIFMSGSDLQMKANSSIATAAETANGGNISLSFADRMFLTDSRITTSVLGAAGNGGNITIDPQFLILQRSSIIAQAVGGNGGNILINAGIFFRSSDSVVSASSQLGISGIVEIVGPRVDLNGSLVVLSSELRGAADVLRTSCAARSAFPRSSLTQGGRGGMPQDPESVVPALYLAEQPIPPAAHEAHRWAPTRFAPLHLSMRCD